MSKDKKSVREAALDVLESVEKNQSYSNLLLNHAIKKHGIKGPDTGLLTELTYGTIQRRMTLDFYLAPFINKKLESWVRQLLRLSLYQMIYLDKIPDRAILFEAVEIGKKRGHKGIASMVNGVLRSVQRKGVPSTDTIQDPVERISIETSHPKWLVKRWTGQFGIEKTREMCEKNITAPLQTARVNTLRTTVDELVSVLTDEGLSVQKSSIVPHAIVSLKGNLAKTDAFKKGLMTIQDESSMLVGHSLDVKEGFRVLDACAAPGGKSTHIAELMNGEGKVFSLDLHKHKIKLIDESAARLGLANIDTKAHDSRKAGEIFEPESFDRILVDAPCSGLGVLRRKPDIKYSKNESDLESLQKIQLEILKAVSPLLKKGGLLVYSTCTVDRIENQGTVERFLKHNPELRPFQLSHLPETVMPFIDGHMLQIFPQDFGGDGFFISCFQKDS
ncbi:16S rRNA (cytosine(967)-C(5))-methyltransferase RsmB [Bacillus sp. P14.5]|uniref:16S rRNA (cytosine(967)-C(5))-methyltransferase RsmB n=1 Tax=Bacillus sp. P14.5 TaxID=1983400 RepID=UPI000DEA3387|nr:16S rRNA (cytosine(967)-C(5))-methyltransferase RsmB [Bacillus sp. P14.5]